ncbi:MAG: hypothetical protein E7271_04485 [Lachnospiraceae bacterium]|jgi:hypothetical protein|nr:hypothetical protein [Lachnospiraceae bacterium]
MIRPIDMQMLLPRTESVGSERQMEQQRMVNANNNAANEVAKEVQHNSESVVHKDGNAFTEYKYDAKEEGNGTYQNPKRQKKKDDGEDSEEDKKATLSEKQKKEMPRINIQI